MEQKGYQIMLREGDNDFVTLNDILPKKGDTLDILFIAKTPASISVEAGHYFQGRQGTMFWNKLVEYKILPPPVLGSFHDDLLLENHYGITDIVKRPYSYGQEPSKEEYKIGAKRILNLIKEYNPKVIVFVYKKVLDNILKEVFAKNIKSSYGMNVALEKLFGSKVFVFPMPGTPCTTEQSCIAMQDLKKCL